MKWSECKELIRKDYIQLVGNSQISVSQAIVWGGGGVKSLITNHSYKITYWFRIGNYLLEKKNPLWKPLYWIVAAIYKHNQYKTGIQMPLGTKAGGGLLFPHFGCIIINETSTIGENVHIYQGVTLGNSRGHRGSPVIGNNVVLFGGSKVIGGVIIGDYSVIGANAVVTKNVPSGCVVAGIPAKVVSQKGEEISKLYTYKK